MLTEIHQYFTVSKMIRKRNINFDLWVKTTPETKTKNQMPVRAGIDVQFCVVRRD